MRKNVLCWVENDAHLETTSDDLHRAGLMGKDWRTDSRFVLQGTFGPREFGNRRIWVRGPDFNYWRDRNLLVDGPGKPKWVAIEVPERGRGRIIATFVEAPNTELEKIYGLF